MFDIGSTELLLIVIMAVIVIGPKDLPRAMYRVGQLLGKARGMARHFRTGVDAMVREVEMEELEKKWAGQNRRIMEEHPSETSPADDAERSSAAPGGVDPPSSPPPFVAQSAPAAPAPASDGPPYLVAQPDTSKGDTAA